MFDLTAYLPYLINRTGVELAGAFSREIAHRGVTLQMWRVLAALHHRDGLRISDLAGLTSIDISTLSRLIGKMEKRCLVTRRRSPEADGRVVTVAVAPAGQAATRAHCAGRPTLRDDGIGRLHGRRSRRAQADADPGSTPTWPATR